MSEADTFARPTPLPSGYNAGQLTDADVSWMAANLAPMYGTGSEVRWVLERVAAEWGRLRHRASGWKAVAKRNRDMQAELARLRALASSSSAIREAATRFLDAYDANYQSVRTVAAVKALRAALSSSGASPTDTNPRD